MTYKLNGTIFVYNPEDKKQAEELNLWYTEKAIFFFLSNILFILVLGIIILLKNQIYQKNVVYLLHQKKITMKKEVEVVMKQNYVRNHMIYFLIKNFFFSLATLFSDIPRITFNGKTDEIESIKQIFADYLKKVTAETSRGHEQDERFT
jgi:hypothetical protein